MARDRMIIMPPRITTRQKTTVPRLDYKFVYPDVLHGAQVRLVVYDAEQYRQNNFQAGGLEGPNWKKFKQGDADRARLDMRIDPQYPEFGSQLDPSLGKKTGILLKVDGVILRSQKVAAP